MALHHAASGELIDIRPLGEKLSSSPSVALARTTELEVMRLVLPIGRELPKHQVPGEIMLQCLEGAVELLAHERIQPLHAGEMVYLAGNVPYALRAIANSSVLMTVLLKHHT